eukprot:10698126-Alexandrium_andersonii.AAC.1
MVLRVRRSPPTPAMGLEVLIGQLPGGARTRRLDAMLVGSRMHTRRDPVVEHRCVQGDVF